MHSDQRLIRDAERWFRSQGLPWIARDNRIRTVLFRILPLLVFTLTFITMFRILVAATQVFRNEKTADGIYADPGLLGLLLVFAVASAGVITWLFRKFRDRIDTPNWAVITVPLVIGFLAWPLLAALTASEVNWQAIQSDLILTASLFMIIYVVTWAGIGSMIWWALKKTFGGFGHFISLATRALPILLTLVTFLFLTSDAWQIGSALTLSRLGGISLFFYGTLMLYHLTRMPEELRSRKLDFNPRAIRVACVHTPLFEWASMTNRLAGRPHSLRQRENVNLLLVLIVMQQIQAMFLGLLVFLFFLLFGSLVLPDTVVAQWVGEATHATPLFGFDLGLTSELTKVSILIAAFAAFSFGIQLINDAQYREHFLIGMLEELERVMLVREAYLRLSEEIREAPSPTEVTMPIPAYPATPAVSKETRGTRGTRSKTGSYARSAS
ncbi:hypothetical protein D5S17_10805 [Pseudonocardiaceae bacterium YIM PH 21723]|nr:hypothetical protein D5S17_10805 [Pseudonocardiaceae bacterium YIM PH 21723]